MKKKIPRECRDYLNDILDCLEMVQKFISGLEHKNFLEEDKTVFAVIRALEVIGEASKNIPEKIRKRSPEIPWKERLE